MKKLALITLASTFFLTSCAKEKTAVEETTTSDSQLVQTTSDLSYQDYVAGLTPINFEELTVKMQHGDKFLLYLGRETCQYCNIFVPKLYEVLQDQEVTVYYYDTEDRDNEELIAFREKFDIETVPNFSYYEGDQLIDTLEKGSQSTVEEIAALLSRLEG